MYRLHTPAAEVAQALLIVMRRGSLRAAEEITGHKYETIGEWLRRASEHEEALTAVFTPDLHLSTVEIDEFWSFVRKKTGNRTNPIPAHAGDALCKTAPAVSSPPAPLDVSVRTSSNDWSPSPSHAPKAVRSPAAAMGAAAMQQSRAQRLVSPFFLA